MKKYPRKLLPQPKYKSIECNLGKYHLVRHFNTNGMNDAIEDATNKIKNKYICHPSGNIKDLSTNLVGRFKLKHLKIELTEKGKKSFNVYCEPDFDVDLPVYDEDFVLNKDRDKWFLPINYIENTEVDYNIAGVPYKAKCIIVHTPMKWNFWHYSIKWILDEGNYWDKLNHKNKKNWEVRLSFTARTHIKQLASMDIPEFKVLGKKHYIK